jgi:hypothetical protein
MSFAPIASRLGDDGVFRRWFFFFSRAFLKKKRRVANDGDSTDLFFPL